MDASSEAFKEDTELVRLDADLPETDDTVVADDRAQDLTSATTQVNQTGTAELQADAGDTDPTATGKTGAEQAGVVQTNSGASDVGSQDAGSASSDEPETPQVLTDTGQATTPPTDAGAPGHSDDSGLSGGTLQKPDAGRPSSDASLDQCPLDPTKSTPGVCGCGTPDTDTDGDLTPDCNDTCAQDPDKVDPGECGCGLAETQSSDGAALCQVLRGALAHRYSFSEANTTIATDTVGSSHGVIVNTRASAGVVTLAGGLSDQYVDLPDAALAGLVDITLEAWVIWRGGASWQRIVDFGSNDAGQGVQAQPGQGVRSLVLTPLADTGGVRAGFGLGTGTPSEVNYPTPLEVGVLSHLAIVFDDTGNQLSLFINGQLAGRVSLDASLVNAQINNTWLGRSQYFADPELGGSIDEFRIYSTALDAETLSYSYNAGPNAVLP